MFWRLGLVCGEMGYVLGVLTCVNTVWDELRMRHSIRGYWGCLSEFFSERLHPELDLWATNSEGDRLVGNITEALN